MPKYTAFSDNTYQAHVKVTKLVGRNKKVLEIGCAAGYLSKTLKEKGNCLVWGIERDKDAAQIAAKYCQEVIPGNIELMQDLPLREKFFDVLLFADVLEHLRNPLATLKRLGKYLKDNGRVVISIPNVANWSIRYALLRGRFDYQPYGILDEGHLRFFNLNSTKRLVEEAGLKIVTLDVTPGIQLLPHYRQTIHRLFSRFMFYHKIMYLITRTFKNLFAFQFIILAEKD